MNTKNRKRTKRVVAPRELTPEERAAHEAKSAYQKKLEECAKLCGFEYMDDFDRRMHY